MALNETIKLSIITVTYNAEKYLSETLNSMLRQQYKNYEYLVVDGCSTDGTISILEDYISRFEGRLRYISEPDRGLYDAMNKGIGLTTGNYIGLINADDYYSDDALVQVVQTISDCEKKPDVVYSDMTVIDENNQFLKTIVGDCRQLKRGMLVNHPTCFVSREAYIEYGLFDLRYRICADYDLMLRILHGGGLFVKCRYTLANYRMGGLSTNNYNSIREKYDIQRKYYGILHCLYIKLRGFYRCKVRPKVKAIIRGNYHSPMC